MKTPFFWPVRVYYEDTDAGGVVYYANYLKFFERARTERLRAMGFEQDAIRSAHGVIFAVKSAQVDYLRPARFNDALWVSAEITELKRASLSFAQEIRRDSPEGERLCAAAIRIVCLSATEMRPVPIPGHLLERIRDVMFKPKNAESSLK
jgi:acyl-CoA thioester hydrolase